MNKLNLKNCGLFLVILSITALFSCSLDLFGGGKTPEPGDDDVVRTDYCAEYDIDCDIDEVKEYWQAAFDVDDILFRNNGTPGEVWVILDKKSSFDFDKVYTPSDFSEINYGYGVIDETRVTINQIKLQLEFKKNNDWNDELQRYSDSGVLVDVDKFRRVLRLDFIKVDMESDPSLSLLENVYKRQRIVAERIYNAIKLIETREDVIGVFPFRGITERVVGFDTIDLLRLYRNYLYLNPDPYTSYVSVSGSFKGLSVEIERQVKQTFFEDAGYYKPPATIDNMIISKYLGTYKGCVAVLMNLINSAEAGVSPPIVVGNIVFYPLHNLYAGAIRIWKEGKFYNLQEAYDLEFLTVEDLKNIAYFWHGGRELN
jgi:hypothetical protein